MGQKRLNGTIPPDRVVLFIPDSDATTHATWNTTIQPCGLPLDYGGSPPPKRRLGPRQKGLHAAAVVLAAADFVAFAHLCRRQGPADSGAAAPPAYANDGTTAPHRRSAAPRP